MPCTTTPTGVTLHYNEAGSGRPIIFLHGWAMSGRVWHFQESLSDCGRLIFLDQRGHGRSSTGPSYLLKDFAEDLTSLFDSLQLQDAVLVGWSMGVQVALEAFPALRSSVSGLVLVGGTPRFTTAEGYPCGQAPVEVKGMGVRLRRDYQKTMGEFFRGMFAEGEMDKAQYQRIVHEVVMSGQSPDHAAAAEALKILSVADQREQLAQVDRPVLLVHGKHDAIVPASASEYMAQRLPMATLKIMEGCGHAPFMTRPEEFNHLLRDFLATPEK
jgi:pimeloyl-ACP methyl ester esterase